MTKQNLEEGTKVKITEKEKVIDEAIIRRVGMGGHPPTNEIKVESLNLSPGKTFEFAFIKNKDPDKTGWKMLFEDPMDGSRCFGQRAPVYTFELT